MKIHSAILKGTTSGEIEAGSEQLVMSSTGGGFSLPTTTDRQEMTYMYVNGILNISMVYFSESGAGANSGTGDYLFHLPSGYAFDTNIVLTYSGNVGSSINNTYLYGYHLPGYGYVGITSTTSRRAIALPYDSTTFRLVCLEIFDGSGGGTFEGAVRGGNFSIPGSNIGYRVTFTAPVVKL